MDHAASNNHDWLRYYAWAVSALILVGESATLASTDKFLPLGADDLAFGLSMLALTARSLDLRRLGLMCGAWCFEFGSLYTTYFTRIDPHGGTGERLAALLILMALSAIGAIWTFRRLRLLG